MTTGPHDVSEETLLQIAEAINGVRFGSVQITIHDSRVVQIETTQKIRLDSPKAHLIPPPAASRTAALSASGREVASGDAVGGGMIPGGCNNHLSCADQTAGGKRPFVEHNGHASGDALPRR